VNTPQADGKAVAKPLDEAALSAAIANNLDHDDPEALERAELMAAIVAWVLEGGDTPADASDEMINPVNASAPRRPDRTRKAKQIEAVKANAGKGKNAGLTPP
jgi:hypothetical protein